MSYYFGPRLYLAEYPPEVMEQEGKQYVVVDKPIIRLPSYIEHLPKKIQQTSARMIRRLQIWKVKETLPGKPWKTQYQRRSDYQQQQQKRRMTPNRSIKPKLDDF